ncbi:MAG: hypothetical protein NC206_05685, partial [Bacteroides sp.]|nr:hypothetical protein [Bacteroides sp.]
MDDMLKSEPRKIAQNQPNSTTVAFRRFYGGFLSLKMACENVLIFVLKRYIYLHLSAFLPKLEYCENKTRAPRNF